MKWTDRGFWVSTLYKYQSLWYWVCYSIHFRSITFFSAANPGMHLGGMLDDKKTAIYDLVHPQYLPLTKVIKYSDDPAVLMTQVKLSFPVIVKPNVGFKGFMVRRVDSVEELQKIQHDFGDREMLLQEFIDLDREYSIMCYKHGNEGSYRISSFVEKVLPHITGDGIQTIQDLIRGLKSPFLNKDLVIEKHAASLDVILPKGEVMTVDHVGNYARGAKFYNRADHIDVDLTRAINRFFSDIKGLNFGRLDLKASSIDDIKNGHFKLLEINGAKAEPIHIYDPAMSIFEMIRDISFHWKTLFTIVKENRDHNVPTTAEGWRSLRSLKKAVNP